MKKKVLFALIALFSFLSSWAQTNVVVQAGDGYAAEFDQTETWVAAGLGLPEVVGITRYSEPVAGTISPALDGTYKVVQKVGSEMEEVSKNTQANPLPVGNYYLVFTVTGTNTMNTVYVPFQVAQEVPQRDDDHNIPGYEFIWNEETFVNSCNNGALALYYDFYAPQFDSERGEWTVVASTADGKYAAVEGLPWIAFEAPESGSYKVMWVYDDPTINENNPCNPWCEKEVQTFGKTGTDRRFGLASVAERTSFNHHDWQIGVDPDNAWALVGFEPNPQNPQEGAFNVNKFHMYWIPAEPITALEIDPESIDRTDISGWTWALPEITFNGQEQKLDAFFEAETAKVQETASSITHLTFGTDFTATYVDAGDYTNAGEGKSVTITGIGAYKGSFQKTYTILPYALDAGDFSLTPAGPYQYNGENQAPTVVGEGVYEWDDVAEDWSDEKVELGTSDFTATLYKVGTPNPTQVDAAIAAGDYFYAITLSGNYVDAMVDNQPIKLPFTVNGINLSNLAVVTMPTVTTVEDDPATTDVNEEVKVPGYVYNTEEQKPVFTTTSTATLDATVTYNKGTELEPVMVTLVEGTDFTVEWTENGDYTNVGQKPFIINFMGSYEGEIEGNYEIFAKNIADTDVSKKFTAPTFNPTGVAQITADNFDLEYNDVALVLGEEATGDFSWAWADGSNGESGSQTIVVTGKGNYTGTWENTFQVKAFAVTITPATAIKVYGEEDPAPNFTIDANSATPIVYGDEEWQYIQSFLTMERNINDANNSDELRETVVEGGHKYAIKIKDPNAECNYEILIQNNDGILMIYPAPLTVHVANDSKTYGDPDPSFIADKSATEKFQILSGETDVTNEKDFVDETKNLKDVLNIGRVAGEDVKDSPYDFTWDNPNYDVTFEPTSFTINPKQVTIEVAFDGNGYEYKGAEWNPMPIVTIKNSDTQLVNPKDFAISWAPGTGLNDLINVTEGNNTTNNRWPKGIVSQAENGNYTFNSVEAYFKITKAELNIIALTDNKKAFNTADPSPLSIPTFATGKGPKGRDNDGNGQLKSDVTFYKNGQPNTPAKLIIREEGEHTGNYEISINPDARTRNYNIVSNATANFLIYRTDQILISFDPDPKNITYGDALDLTTLIKITAPTGVNTADLLADVKQNVKKYQKLDPETGEVDDVDGVKTYIDDNNVGTYHLTIDDVPTAFKNYDVVLTEGILNIGYYPLFIRSVDEKMYGDDEPADYAWDVYEWVKVGSTWQYVKFTRDEIEVPEADLIGNSGNYFEDMYRYTISREPGEAVGHYETTIRETRLQAPSNPFAWPTNKSYGEQYYGNYSFVLEDGDFEITRRALTVAVTGAEKFYGEYDPEKVDGEWVLSEDLDENEEDNISVFTKGLVKITITNALPEDLAMICGKVTFTSREGGEVVKAGGYQVKNVNFDGVPLPGSTRLDNYTLSYSNNANFMINKRVLKVTAHDQSVPYAIPLVVEPYDLTVEGILIDNVYQTANPKGVKYFDDVTVMSGKGTTTTAPAISDQVDEVFKPLEVVEGKTAVGVFHRDAFKLELTDAAKQNYELEFTNGKLYIEDAPALYLDMANLAQALQDHIGRTVEVRLCGAEVKEEGCDPFRQFVAYQWNSFVLPFDILPRDLSAAFRYAAIDLLSESNNTPGEFTFATTTRRITANTPFVFQDDKNWTYADAAGITFGERTIADFDYLNADPTAEDAAGNKIIGTYKPKSEFDASNYIMKLNSGEFFRFVDGASYAMKQTEAYLESATGSDAPARIIIEEADGSTTAIEFVGAEAVTTTSAAEGWYTINGVKLEGEPTTSGTYIFNGKKVFIQK
jgi:hypothetical protein